MFFLKEMTHPVTLGPEYFASNLKDLIRYALYRQLEGTCHGTYGYIVAIVSVDSISKGVVRDSSGGLLATQSTLALAGTATFTATFKAIVYRPFKGEVADAVVKTANKMGFFAEMGPVQVFVSSHLIPSKFHFDSISGAAYVQDRDQLDYNNDEDEDMMLGSAQIVAGSRVRVRIVGTRVDAAEIFAIGTIKEDHLGLLQE